MANPAWQTDELGEEWIDSPSPPQSKAAGSQRNTSGPKCSSTASGTTKGGFGSIADKRGSLRSLGHSAPRGLPSRPPSSDTSPARIVSGHGSGSRLFPSGDYIVPQGTGLLSPPSSRSSSEGDAPGLAEGGTLSNGPGTCVVKDGVDDDRGGGLARIGAKSKDIFGKNALERMFEPPSPPSAPLPSTNEQSSPTAPVTTTPQRPPPSSYADLGSSPSPSPSAIDDARRASHPFAPRNPSRLSKSMTPSSHSSNPPSETSQLPADQSALTADETLPPAEDEEEDGVDSQFIEHGLSDEQYGQDANAGLEVSLQHMSLASGEIETDLSPMARGATRFPFTFKAPIRTTSGQTASASGTGSGSATLRGGSVRSQAPVPAEQDDEFEALFNEPDTGEGPSHSTIHRHQPQVRHDPSRPSGQQPRLPKGQAKVKANASGKSPRLPPNPNLRLFRSTYDTYTREHLSAIVDSIALEASPSPPPAHLPHARDLAHGEEGDDEARGNTWGSGGSCSGSSRSTDSRSSKRLRLSPPSPKRQPRDWGNVGLEIMGRIKGRRVEESTTSASPYQSGQSGTSLVDADEGPTIDYPTLPPTPPLDRRLAPSFEPAAPVPRQNATQLQTHTQHRSNPSTASSGYLRTAEAMMANLRQRAVSNSESALSGENTFESSSQDQIARTGAREAGGARRALSETDENAGSSETDAWRSEWEYGQSSKTKGGSGGRGKASGPSPRRLLRGLSAAEERRRARRPLTSTDDIDQDSAPARPAHPNEGVNTEDLARFVSATTVPTYSTTISTSFVKHSGPPVRGQMRMIRPDEVNALLGQGQQVGKMRYDATAMRWVRESVADLGRLSEKSGEESRQVGSEESVDVFAGMSEEGSRRGSSAPPGAVVPAQAHMSPGRQDQQAGMSDTDTDSDDEHDADPARSLGNMTTIDADALVDTSDSEDDHYDDLPHGMNGASTAYATAAASLTASPLALAPAPMPASALPTRPLVTHTNSAPAIMTPLPSSLAPRPIRSALRHGGANSQPSSDRDLAGQLLGTPGLKKKASWVEDINLTPFISPGRSITRSVSFSDGRKVGKIEGLDTGTPSASLPARKGGAGAGGMSISEQLRGLGEQVRQAKEKASTPHARKASMDELRAPTPAEELSGKEGGDGNLFDRNGMSLLASARTRRIQEVLGDMEELSLDNITPSKPSRYPEPVRQPAPLAPTPNPRLGLGVPASKLVDVDVDADTDPAEPSETSSTTLPARSFRRSRSHRENNPGQAGTTFLTECSFAATSDQLVKVITDVQPFEPYWEELREVDLSAKGLEGVGRLKEFLPALDEVNLNDNAISYLTGIPSSVRTLHVAGNRLSSLTSVDHLRNLQVLDLSRNQLDSVSQLRCLKHLRDLRADNNRISDLSGIMGMDSLLKLSVRANRVDRLDLRGSRWGKLESLDLAENGLGEILGLEELRGVVVLNLDGNDLTTLTSTAPGSAPLTSLRTLRVCRNDLALLDLAYFPKIRTLYADENRLVGLQRSDRNSGRNRSRLEALSMRSQRSRGLKLDKGEVGGLKRLYISGNDLPPTWIPTMMPQLTYLEMAACRLSSWPVEMAKRLPALEVLNANYNFLETLDGIEEMAGLRKVTVVGNRLGDLGDQERLWMGLKGLQEVDLRMNPGTLGFYLSLFSPLPATTSAPARPHLSRPNKTAILLGRNPANGAGLSASTRTNPWTSFAGLSGTVGVGAQGGQEDWAEMDRAFRRNLPDGWYSRRLAYRGGVMRCNKALRVLDGLEVGEGERKKAGELLFRLRGETQG